MRKEIRAIGDKERSERTYGHTPITVVTPVKIPESVKWHMRHRPYEGQAPDGVQGEGEGENE